MIYLDNAATTAVRTRVLEEMWPYLTADYGNPSSTHSLGESAARALAGARARIAAIIGCSPAELVFTSGGTESDNLAIKGMALERPRGRHIVTSPVEHEAVLESCDYLVRHHGFTVAYADVTAEGIVTAEALRRVLHPDTTLVTVMHASNEIGSVQPVAELAAAAHDVGALFHTDAVQSVGAIDVHVDDLGVDTLAFSGHKFGAPKGSGALFVRRGIRLEPLVHGGGQERGRRSGTENVAAAIGLAAALTIADETRRSRSALLEAARDRFIAAVLESAPGAFLTGHPRDRLPGHASFCLPGTNGEAVLLELDHRGVVCSSGSACAAGQTDPSHVLLALGIDDGLAQTAIRFTIGPDITNDELDRAVAALRDALARLGALGSAP